MEKRIQNFVKSLKEIEAAVVSSKNNRYYLTGFNSWSGTLLATKSETFFVTDSGYFEEVQRKVPFVTAVLATKGVAEKLKELCQKMNITQLGYEQTEMTCTAFEGYRGAMPTMEFVPIGGLVQTLRQQKDETEKAYIRKAQEITDLAFGDFLKKVRVGMTEKEVEKLLVMGMCEFGAEGPIYPPICVSGPNTSLPHGSATERKIQNGDFLTMDFGAAYKGYWSDMTRTIAFGAVSEEMKRVYDTVYGAQQAALGAVKANVVGSELDQVARDVIVNAGYGDYFTHGLGHSFGIDVHEMPLFSKNYGGVVPLGAAMTVEPGIYMEGKFGVRIEDDIFVEEQGCENITKSPKELLII